MSNPGPVGRHLTPAAKRETLRAWGESRRAPYHGPGSPDAAMVPWCEQINALSGVCTVQSCAGHKRGRWRTCGHLWLWLAEDVAGRFDARAFELTHYSTLERVYRLYTDWGQELVVIEFQGEEWGRLNDSMTTVLSYLRLLTAAT